MRSTTIVLILMFLLLVPLFLAAATFRGPIVLKSPPPLSMGIETTSSRTLIYFDGAVMEGIRVTGLKDNGLKKLDLSNASISMQREKGADDLPTEVNVSFVPYVGQDIVTLVIDKDATGNSSVTIGGIGEFKQGSNSFKIPLRVNTTSEWTTLTFSGASILQSSIGRVWGRDVTEPVIGTNFITLSRRPGGNLSQIGAEFLLDINFDQELAIVTIERGDGGSTQAEIGPFGAFENPEMTPRKVLSVPITIQTTADLSEISFQGGTLRKVESIKRAGDFSDLLIRGSNTLHITKTSPGYGSLEYRLEIETGEKEIDLGISRVGTGFTLVQIGDAGSYANAGREKNLTTVHHTVDLSPFLEVDRLTPEKIEKETAIIRLDIPLSVLTTSDWTKVTFRGVNSIRAKKFSVEGDVLAPSISVNSILISKPRLYDQTPATAYFDLEIELQRIAMDKIQLVIERGDIGYTTVEMPDVGRFTHERKIKDDPSNMAMIPISFEEIAKKKAIEGRVYYNPVSFSLPYINLVGKLPTGAAKYKFLSQELGERPYTFSLRPSESIGVIAGVLLSYLVLSILGIQLLAREGYFSFAQEGPNGGIVSAVFRGLFERTPPSSLLILEALALLVPTALILMVDSMAANALAILAYLFLALGLVLHLIGRTELPEKVLRYVEVDLLMFLLKIGPIIAILAGVNTIGYQFLGLRGLLAAGVPSLFFLFMVYGYIDRYLGKAHHTHEW